MYKTVKRLELEDWIKKYDENKRYSRGKSYK